jgi:phage N-6-adenine-methyltransferase
MALTISPELQSLIPPLSDEELAQLQANLLADGCRDALIVWAEEQILLDGHHRLEICERHNLPFTLQEISLPDLDAARLWMLENQLGRRNLSPNQMAYFIGEKYNLLKRQGKRTDLTSHQIDGKSHSTAQILADQFKVGPATIERDGAFAAAVDTLATVVGPDARQAILSGDLPLPKQDVPALASLVEQSPEAGAQITKAFKSPEAATDLKAILTAARQSDGTHVYRVGDSGPLLLEPEASAANETAAPATWPQTVSSGDHEWFTPDEILIPVRKVLGEIDLDPASCEAAQFRVRARTYFTATDDGLRQPWIGTVFCNPPYKLPLIARFIGKLFEEIDAKNTTQAILLVNAATETDWFQAALARADAVCFPDGRIHFQSETRNSDNPCQGQAILYYGADTRSFGETFAALGVTTLVMAYKAAYEQLDLESRASEAPPQRRKKGELEEDVFQTVQRLGSCSNAQVKEALGLRQRQNAHESLQRLLKKGRVVREGDTYRVNSLD